MERVKKDGPEKVIKHMIDMVLGHSFVDDSLEVELQETLAEVAGAEILNAPGSDDEDNTAFIVGKDLDEMKARGFTGDDYSFTFYADKNTFEITNAHGEDSERMLVQGMQEILEKYGEQSCPKNIATGTMTVNLKTRHIVFLTTTVHP